MGVLTASPEAGVASVNMIPHMKKHNAISDDSSKSFRSTISNKNAISQNPLRSAMNYKCSNITDKNLQKELILMESPVFNKLSISTICDSCQFPYYRSNRNGDGYVDAVLVKDVGVSCMLLKQNISEVLLPATSEILKQLKAEYCDLSYITNKITTYTKDIMSHLTKKKHRKHQLPINLVASKHAIASQYVDSKDNLCLKLRLLSNAESQCTSQEIVKNRDKVARKYYKERNAHEKGVKPKYKRNLETIIKKNNTETNTSSISPPCTSSVYNYLTLKKANSSRKLLHQKHMKFGNVPKYRNSKSLSDNVNCQGHLRRCSPQKLTDWKEISELKPHKNKTWPITSKKSQQTARIKSKAPQEEFFSDETTHPSLNTKFHNMNIRILK